MKEIIPGIYQLQLPMGDFPPGHVNAYLVRGDKGYVLIDTGWDTEELSTSFEQQLAEFDISIDDIYQILLTHSHTDHGGRAGKLSRQSKAPIYLHKMEIDIIKSRFTCADNLCGDRFLKLTDQLLGTHGVPSHELGKPYPLLPEIRMLPLPDVTLDGGEIISAGIFNFQVIWTPGHSPGHVCYYEPVHKLLFSGDHVMLSIVPTVSLHLQHNTDPLDNYLRSIDEINRLEVGLVLPGHGELFSNLSRRIQDRNE